jgi:hypothetical protein
VDLAAHLLSKRDAGLSFGAIAMGLQLITGVSLTPEVVRRWVRQLEEERSEPASVLPGHEQHSKPQIDPLPEESGR